MNRTFYLEIYRRMVRIRLFEESAERLQARGEVSGALHTATGQEGEIVGACMALDKEDYMVGNHRSHGHPIGKGAATDRLMAELLGRKTGVNQGKGGSMHLADFSVGSLGETSIVGSGLPVATGAALGAKMQGSGRVSLCFFGDGASNEGTFHESLNLASIWKLPVIFLCENNGYAITTKASDTLAVKDVAERAAGYAMPGHVVDGQDALAVYNVVKKAVDVARSGGGPALIEAKTYRFNEHALGLRHVKYRTDEEINVWRERDPLLIFRQQVLEKGLVSSDELSLLDEEVKAEIEASVQFALNSPHPDAAEAFDHLYAQPIA